MCDAGEADTDNDPWTACEVCPAGSFVPDNASSLVCTPCAAGRFDNDTNASTPCLECDTGRYAAAGSVKCTNCIDGLGTPHYPISVDHDKDPATECFECDYGWVSSEGGTKCLNICPEHRAEGVQILSCGGDCAPWLWYGDGFCDTVEYAATQHFFCVEAGYDNGDCPWPDVW